MIDNNLRDRFRAEVTSTRPSAQIQTNQHATKMAAVKLGTKRGIGAVLHQGSSKSLTLFWKSLIGLALLIALASGIYAATQKKDQTIVLPQQNGQATNNDKKSSSSIDSVTTPKAAAAKTGKQLHYPSSLPEGYAPLNDFQVIGNKTVTYSVKDDNKNIYTVSEQPLPANFDSNTFAKNFTNIEQFTLPIGSVLIGDNNSELIGSVRTKENSWILIGAPSIKLRPQMKAIISGLKQSN